MESDKYPSRLMEKVRLAMYSKPFVCVAARSCRRIDLATVAFMLLTVGGTSCSRPAAQREYPVQRDFPNVLLISIDTTRRDHCSTYGYQRPTTPVLDELGQQGAVFDLAYAPIATTAPSHATMLTGCYPISHRLIKNGLTLDKDYTTLPEMLRPHGFQSAAVVSAFVLDSKFGLAQGFDHYDDDIPPAETTWKKDELQGLTVPQGSVDRRADFTSSRAIQWLRGQRNPERPFFMLVHYFAPHFPYVPPEEFAQRFVPAGAVRQSMREQVGLYDAEIAYTDTEIGRLLKELETLQIDQNTIVVVTADHGEGLKQHGYMFHAIHIYEEAVRVPLIIRYPPQISAGRRFSEPVEFTDLVPTLLDLLEIDVPAGLFQGTNLAGALRGEAELESDRPVFLHRRHFSGLYRGDQFVKGELFGVRKGDWKYIEGKEENMRQLFNLQDDPLERKNLLNQYPENAQRLVQLLEQWQRTNYNAKPALNNMTDEDIRKLRSLGYVQ
jgi:arylsulfatase A-like enzyme